jgi:hypothetical protein
MDDWTFLSLAKARADLAVRGRGSAHVTTHSDPFADGLTKEEAATALEHPFVRGALAIAIGALVNVLFFSSVELTALDARVPGEVVVAEVESASPDYAAALLKE